MQWLRRALEWRGREGKPLRLDSLARKGCQYRETGKGRGETNPPCPCLSGK
jgi:hypothetical protein